MLELMWGSCAQSLAQRLKLSVRCQTLPRPVREGTRIHMEPEFCHAQCETLQGFTATPEFVASGKMVVGGGGVTEVVMAFIVRWIDRSMAG